MFGINAMHHAPAPTPSSFGALSTAAPAFGSPGVLGGGLTTASTGFGNAFGGTSTGGFGSSGGFSASAAQAGGSTFGSLAASSSGGFGAFGGGTLTSPFSSPVATPFGAARR